MFKSATKVTLLSLVLALIVLTFLGKADSEPFKTVILMVVSFYFGRQERNQSTNVQLEANSTK